MERQHKTLLQGLVGNDLFQEALTAALAPEIEDLTKKMRAAVRGSDLVLASHIEGQIVGLEKLIPILQRVSADR